MNKIHQNCDYLFLLGALLLNLAVWIYTSSRLPEWANVPLAPSTVGTTAAFLGDTELAYRSMAFTLQSFGNDSGQIQALKDYNYENLGTWFDLTDNLNPRSDYVPFLAAYYFGANQDPSKLMPVINYLRRVGTYSEADKWRYLGQAVFLAYHKMGNKELGLELAGELEKTYKPGMPAWPLQMRAILASKMGEKEMAYNMMLDALQNQKEGLDPIEINYMVDQICNHLITPEQRKTNPLCENVKP